MTENRHNRGKMDKQKIRETLEHAVRETHKKYPNFQGVVLFGSFVKGKKDPFDVDLVPVLETYKGSWTFCTDDEGDYDEFYDEYEEMRDFFGDHFKQFAEGYESLFRTYTKKGLLHIESLVVLDNLPRLKERLDHYHTGPGNFIGTEKAAGIIADFYKRAEQCSAPNPPKNI